MHDHMHDHANRDRTQSDQLQTHRQYLVRCTVDGAGSSGTSRYIPAADIGLWQYSVAHRHHLEVSDMWLGLWLPMVEYNRQTELFDRAGNVESVVRLDIDLFDEELGLSHLVSRFCSTADTELLKQKLLARLAPAHQPSRRQTGTASDTLRCRVQPGTFVPRRAVHNTLQVTHPLDWAALAQQSNTTGALRA